MAMIRRDHPAHKVNASANAAAPADVSTADAAPASAASGLAAQNAALRRRLATLVQHLKFVRYVEAENIVTVDLGQTPLGNPRFCIVSEGDPLFPYLKTLGEQIARAMDQA